MILKLRPCVILQNNIGNFKSGNVLVAPITHTFKNIPSIKKITTKYNSYGSILLDGYINVSNIQCVSKSRLENYITVLSKEEMKEIDEAIAISLDLMHYYAKVKNSLEDKIKYIQKIKSERNEAQEQIKELLEICNTKSFDELKKILKKYRQSS